MGNLHGVLQIEPVVHVAGAALRIRPGFEKPAKEKYAALADRDYTELAEHPLSFRINNPNIGAAMFTANEAPLFLIVQSGGKWGYDANLEKVFAELGAHLEDGLFFIDDEYAGYVERWQLANGKLTREIVVESEGNAFDYAESHYANDAGILFPLYLSQVDYLTEDAYEGTYKEAERCLKQARAIEPSDPSVHERFGALELLKKDHAAALESLTRAVALREATASPRHWGNKGELVSFEDDFDGTTTEFFKRNYQRMAEAYAGLNDPMKALEYYDRSYNVTPRFGNVWPLVHAAVTQIGCGALEDAERRLDEALKHSPSRSLSAAAHYNRACVCALQARIAEALRDLAVAVALNDGYAKMAADDEDFSSIRSDPRFKAIVDPDP